MKTIIEGVLAGALPWGLVLTGAGLSIGAMLLRRLGPRLRDRRLPAARLDGAALRRRLRARARRARSRTAPEGRATRASSPPRASWPAKASPASRSRGSSRPASRRSRWIRGSPASPARSSRSSSRSPSAPSCCAAVVLAAGSARRRSAGRASGSRAFPRAVAQQTLRAEPPGTDLRRPWERPREPGSPAPGTSRDRPSPSAGPASQAGPRAPSRGCRADSTTKSAYLPGAIVPLRCSSKLAYAASRV